MTQYQNYIDTLNYDLSMHCHVYYKTCRNCDSNKFNKICYIEEFIWRKIFCESDNFALRRNICNF